MKTLLSTLALGAVLSTFGSAALAAAPAAGSRDLFPSTDAVAATPGDAVILLARQGRGRGGDRGGDSGRGRGRGGDDSRSSSSSGDAGRGGGSDDAPGDDRGGHGTDDPAGDDRGRGRGTDDGPNHTQAPADDATPLARRGRWADDGADHQRRGRGQDDGPNHT